MVKIEEVEEGRRILNMKFLRNQSLSEVTRRNDFLNLSCPVAND